MDELRSFHRMLQGRLKSEKQPLIQVVIGPRQVGKTTAVRAIQVAEQGVYESADSPTPLSAQILEKWWASAEASQGRLLVIDEIQKISGWAEVLKKLWDEQTQRKNSEHPFRVIVTGSSSLQIEKGLKESLAGRFELVRVEHWNFAEAKKVFSMALEQYIGFGCYPGANRFRSEPDRWAEYIRDSIIEPVLGRDLLQLHPVEKPALLRQVFGVALSLPSEIVSLQKIQGQLQDKGSIATLQHYLWLLSEAFLVTGIEKYNAATFQSKRSSPKLIVHDNALIRAQERPPSVEPPRERMGRYLENSVGARFIESGWATRYWRERNQEVDFIVDGPKGEKWAVEVKWTKPIRSEVAGVLEFCKRHPEYSAVVVFVEESQTSLPARSKFELPTSIRQMSAEEMLSLTRGVDFG